MVRGRVNDGSIDMENAFDEGAGVAVERDLTSAAATGSGSGRGGGAPDARLVYLIVPAQIRPAGGRG